METDDPLSDDETQPLCNDIGERPLRRRMTGSQMGIRFGVRTYQSAVNALRESNSWPLLVFMPLGICSALAGWNPVLTLFSNLLSIIPLSALVSNAADLLSAHVGDLVGGLINATFGNTVELSVGILAVVHGEIEVAQWMMIGSMLSDILLILGICITTAAYDRQFVRFNSNATNTLCSLMNITSVCLILPTALRATFETSDSSKKIVDKKILAFSRGCAIILLLLYMMYLYFELGTHSDLFSDKEDAADTGANEQDDGTTPAVGDQDNVPMAFGVAVVVLIIATVSIAICTNFLLDSLDNVVNITKITKRFVATVLLPIPSNAPELTTVIEKARSNRCSFAISVIVDSILQIALFVVPFLVILGWLIRQPMTLLFEQFQSYLLFLAVLAVNRLLKDGKYMYFHGVISVQLYAVIALAVFVRPETT